MQFPSKGLKPQTFPVEPLGGRRERESAEDGPRPWIIETPKEKTIQGITEIYDHVGEVESGLKKACSETSQITDLVTEKLYRQKVTAYGEELKKFRDGCVAEGINIVEFAGKDRVRKLRNGDGIPDSDKKVRKWFADRKARAEGSEKTSTLTSPEWQARLERGAHEATEARKERGPLRKRIDAAEAQLRRKTEFEADLAACVGALRKKVAVLKQQQAASGAQREELRRRIELLEAALNRALERQEISEKELAEWARGALPVFDEMKRYLDSEGHSGRLP